MTTKRTKFMRKKGTCIPSVKAGETKPIPEHTTVKFNDQPKVFDEEPLLSDDYVVHAGYCYVADGIMVMSDISGNVQRLRAALQSLNISANEIRRCNLVARQNDFVARGGVLSW